MPVKNRVRFDAVSRRRKARRSLHSISLKKPVKNSDGTWRMPHTNKNSRG